MKAINIAKSMVKDGDTFEAIVNMCGLKPTHGFVNWIDDGKNVLKIHKNNSIHIYPSKNNIPKKTIRPKTIANNSIWALISYGQDRFNNESTLIWFVGNDGHLRLSFFVEDCWIQNYLPLLSGINILKIINKESKNNLLFKKINIPNIMNMKIDESFGIKWPPDKQTIIKLEKSQGNNALMRGLY